MTNKQKMELLFGSEAHSATSNRFEASGVLVGVDVRGSREEESESDKDVPRKHRRGRDESDSGDEGR